MSEKKFHPPEEAVQPIRGDKGERKETGDKEKYKLEELPKQVRGMAALYLGRIEGFENSIKRIQERIDQGEFAESQALLDGKLADIRGSETAIEANRLLLEKCLSKKENLTTKLLPGYEWRDEGKRIQSRVFKDGAKGTYNGRPICEITIQPDPDDPEFGMIVSVNKHEGTSLTYPFSTTFFNQFEDADFGGLSVGVTTKPFKFRLYNKLPPISVDDSLGSGLAGTKWTQSDRIMCMPPALVDMARYYLNPEDPNDDRGSAELRGGRKRFDLEENYQPDDFGHLKGAEKGEIFTIAAPDSLKSESDRQDLANRLAKHGYNPADYGLPPAKKEEAMRRPEPQPIPEPPKLAEESANVEEGASDWLMYEQPAPPAEPEPPVEAVEEKPRSDVKFVSGDELAAMEREAILGTRPPFSEITRKLRAEYLKLQQKVADAQAQLEQAEKNRGAFSRFFGTGMGPVNQASTNLDSVRSEFERFHRFHHLPIKETQFVATSGDEKPKKRSRGGPDDGYKSMMGE